MKGKREYDSKSVGIEPMFLLIFLLETNANARRHGFGFAPQVYGVRDPEKLQFLRITKAKKKEKDHIRWPVRGSNPRPWRY